MSYEPRLVINRADLEKNADRFEYDWEWSADEVDVYKYIQAVLRNTTDVATIQGIRLSTCQPDLTSFNERVREKLAELGIEYSIF